jgi:hypothetical protein
VQRITELGWPPALAAESLGCRDRPPTNGLAATMPKAQPAWPIAAPRPQCCPHALAAGQVRRVLAARRRRRQGPHRLGYHLGMPRSTIFYGVLARHGMSRLAHTDRASGVTMRYQREHPGELVRLDIKKLGRIPDGGGQRMLRAQGRDLQAVAALADHGGILGWSVRFHRRRMTTE